MPVFQPALGAAIPGSGSNEPPPAGWRSLSARRGEAFPLPVLIALLGISANYFANMPPPPLPPPTFPFEFFSQ